MKMIIVTCFNCRIWRLKLLRFTGRALDTKTLQLSPLTENGLYTLNLFFCFSDMIKDLFKKLQTVSANMQIDLAGSVCACKENYCNTALPQQEPPVLLRRSRTTMTSTKSPAEQESTVFNKAGTIMTSSLLLFVGLLVHMVLA